MATRIRMSIRHIRDDDAGVLAALWHATWHEAHSGLFPPVIIKMRSFSTFVDRLYALRNGILVAELEGSVAGFAAVLHNEVDQFYVAREARGSGLAQDLLSAAEAELARRGVTDAMIQCASGNARAHRFYSAGGWSDTGLQDMPIWMPDERIVTHPTHIFRKQLA